MSENKTVLDEEQLEQVVGGLFVFHKMSKILEYTHQDGSVTNHKILVYDKAWSTCNSLQAQNWDEDKIFDELVYQKYIEA